MTSCDKLPGYDSFRFRRRCVYHRRPDRGGPLRPVVVVHEMPGMTPECVDFANRLAGRGFSPYLPLLFGKPGKGASAARRKAALGIAPRDLERAKRRELPLLALRFSNDWICPRERFTTLREEFDDLRSHEIPSPDPKHGIPDNAHSVLTHEYGQMEERERRERRSIDPDHPLREAFRRVVGFLEDRFAATEPRPS